MSCESELCEFELIMGGRMPHFNRASKDKSDETQRKQTAPRRKTRKGAKKITATRSSNEVGEHLPLIGSLKTRASEKSDITTQAGKRKCCRPPISTALQNSLMAPWEGYSNSESSFISIPLFPLPPPPPLITSSETLPNLPIRRNKPSAQQSVHVKQQPLPSRGPSRPSHLPPLRQVTNLSFSRSFTFSFFELPWHQSVQNRTNRLKELVRLLRKIEY